MEKFVFEDGKVIEFEKFARNGRSYYDGCVNAWETNNITKSSGWTTIHLSPEAKKFSELHVKPSGEHWFVGLLYHKMACGIPEGAYVPIRWTTGAQAGRQGRWEIVLDGLLNESLIYNEKYVNERVKATLKKAQEKKDGEEDAVVEEAAKAEG